MILNEIGKSFEYDGITYAIGDTVIATDASEYEGLAGTILEIRDGEDKETENETPDIYCSFEAPLLPDDAKDLEKTFSDLYGETKTIADIALDFVIMAPDMIVSADSRSRDVRKIKLYAVTEDWANNDNYGYDVTLFAAQEDAMKEFKTLIATEALNGIIADIKGNSDYVEEYTPSRYECYLDGFHCESHYSVRVQEKELLLTPSSLEQTRELAQDIVYRNDFAYQIEGWDEVGKLTQAQYQKMINDPNLTERFKKAFEMADCYWEAYWQVISEVAHAIVDEHTKEAL